MKISTYIISTLICETFSMSAQENSEFLDFHEIAVEEVIAPMTVPWYHPFMLIQITPIFTGH
jgi:hypothetical protein